MFRTERIRLAFILCSTSVIAAFLFGVGVGVFHWFPYKVLRSTYNVVLEPFLVSSPYVNTSVSIDLPGLETCMLEPIDKVPSNSTVVIGHAYGAPGSDNNDGFISSKVETFLDSKKSKIRIVIFTGDVFREPTLEKWSKLYRKYHKSFDIYIAPGNHDVGAASTREQFLQTPFSLPPGDHKLALLNYIIEDSVESNWLISPKTIGQIRNGRDGKVFLFRHNIPVVEMLEFANSNEFMSRQLPSVKEFTEQVGSSKELVVIAGDSGAFEHLPRATCNVFEKITFISNGIGDVNGDSVLIIDSGSIFQFVL